jgi:hypothetical protein
LNPLNTKLSPGGSSGGCAALIAAGGSILGVGTDIGGSLRIPAHFCGIAGMKPTSTRMSHQGFRSTGLVMVPGNYNDKMEMRSLLSSKLFFSLWLEWISCTEFQDVDLCIPITVLKWDFVSVGSECSTFALE